MDLDFQEINSVHRSSNLALIKLCNHIIVIGHIGRAYTFSLLEKGKILTPLDSPDSPPDIFQKQTSKTTHEILLHGGHTLHHRTHLENVQKYCQRLETSVG